MASDQLRELFHQKKENAKAANVDWAAKRDAWIKAVNDLYATIENEYLREAKSDVQIRRADRIVTENFIGEYHISDFVLQVGDEHVIFSPKGTIIVGARGRIDVRGDRGEANLIWHGDKGWSFVAARVPTLRLLPLSADSLAEVLRGIMRP